MYKVSLLPSEYRQIARTAQIKDQALLIASMVMIALFLVYFLLSVNASKKDNELKDISLQNDVLEQQINKYLPLEKLNSDVNDMLEKALAAYGTNPEWNKIISRIGNSLPSTIGLTSLNMYVNEGAGECIVQGTATDHPSLVLWLDTLIGLPQIGEVRYNLSSKTEEDKQGAIQFELNLSLMPGEGYQIQSKEDNNE